ncbi:MAG: DciA family protein [Pseudomonadota bacterium]
MATFAKGQTKRASTTRGFKTASALVQSRVRGASETRGFSQSRVLTHWEEIVGTDLAAMAVPLKVAHGRQFGATLTLLTNGAFAPLLQAQLPKIEERVNAVYGYRAISKIKITQTAPTGFSEGQVAFRAQPKADVPVTESERAAVTQTSSQIESSELRQALQRLGENVMRKARLK